MSVKDIELNSIQTIIDVDKKSSNKTYTFTWVNLDVYAKIPSAGCLQSIKQACCSDDSDSDAKPRLKKIIHGGSIFLFVTSIK